MKLKKAGHIGIIVNDITEAKNRYGELFGIKTWYEIVADTPAEYVYGDVYGTCDIKLYVGGKGLTKLELLEAKSDTPTVYSDFLERRGEGIHHVMYTTKNLDAAVAELEAAGMTVLQRAKYKSAGADINYAYIGFAEDDFILELVETTLFGKLKKGDMPLEIPLGRITGNYKKVK